MLLLGEKGDVSIELRRKIMAEEKEDVLEKCLKLAAKIQSVDEFMQSEEMWEKGYV